MKIRTGFVSNSSSSSFIVISPDRDGEHLQKLRERFGNTVLVVDHLFGTTEFGWEHYQYNSVGSKIIFAYLQCRYLIETNFPPSVEKGQKWLTVLEKAIKDTLGVKEIEWNITTQYNESDKTKSYAYIDHQSASYEGQNVEMFNSFEQLVNFLFNQNSYIETGNDNE